MFLAKVENRDSGYGDLHDSEVQSLIHERNHEFKGAPALTVDEQIALNKQLITQVSLDPRLSEAEKYRKSDKQPGAITRLETELDRLHELKSKGHAGSEPPPKSATFNSGAQVQAMKYLGTRIPETQNAKQQFLEVAARHTGMSMQEASNEWNRVVSKERGGRGDVGIRLTDGWRDSRLVAGLPAQAQDALAQNARSRDAIAHFQNLADDTLASQPSRPTIRAEHRHYYVKPGSEGEQLRCDRCGQFGHQGGQCPNGDIVQALETNEDDEFRAFTLLKAARIQRSLDSDEELEARTLAGDLVTGEDARRILEGERDLLSYDVARGGSPTELPTVNEAQEAYDKLYKKTEDLQETLASRSPKVSTWVKEVGYNPETGLMLVTTHDRVNKSGTISPGKTYSRRVSETESQRILDDPSVGAALNASVMRHGKGVAVDSYQWDNAADMKAALEQKRCPTCGQWAAMTSSHTCPVPGAPESAHQATERARAAQWRRLARTARAEGAEVPPQPVPRANVAAALHRSLGDGGQVFVARPSDIDRQINGGQAVGTPLTCKWPDAEVKGTVTAWEDSQTGQRFVSPRNEAGGQGLRCSCAQYREARSCEHIAKATTSLATALGYAPINHPQVTPDKSISQVHRDANSEASFDAPRGPVERVDYSRLRQFRKQDNNGHVQGLFEQQRAGIRFGTAAVRPPTDGNGNETSWPSTMQRPGGDGTHVGDEINLRDASDVQQRLRQGLFARSREHWSVKKQPDGGMLISVPPSRRAKDGRIPRAERRRLCELLNVPAGRARNDGIYVPADSSWSAEFISRAYGDEPAVRGAKFTIA